MDNKNPRLRLFTIFNTFLLLLICSFIQSISSSQPSTQNHKQKHATRYLNSIQKHPLEIKNRFSLFKPVRHLITEFDNFDRHYFYDHIYNSDKPWILIFYANWCSHSKEFARDFIGTLQRAERSSLARRYNKDIFKNINIGTIDCGFLEKLHEDIEYFEGDTLNSNHRSQSRRRDSHDYYYLCNVHGKMLTNDGSYKLVFPTLKIVERNTDKSKVNLLRMQNDRPVNRNLVDYNWLVELSGVNSFAKRRTTSKGTIARVRPQHKPAEVKPVVTKEIKPYVNVRPSRPVSRPNNRKKEIIRKKSPSSQVPEVHHELPTSTNSAKSNEPGNQDQVRVSPNKSPTRRINKPVHVDKAQKDRRRIESTRKKEVKKPSAIPNKRKIISSKNTSHVKSTKHNKESSNNDIELEIDDSIETNSNTRGRKTNENNKKSNTNSPTISHKRKPETSTKSTLHVINYQQTTQEQIRVAQTILAKEKIIQVACVVMTINVAIVAGVIGIRRLFSRMEMR